MGELLDQESLSIQVTSSETERRVYVPPHLVEYGSVAKLTQGNNGSVADGGSMPTQMKTLSAPRGVNTPAKMR